MPNKYSVIVQWSDEDQAFLVTLPEFGKGPRTHGESYEKAFKNALQVLDLLVESYKASNWPLPKPLKHGMKKPTSKKRKAHRHAKSA